MKDGYHFPFINPERPFKYSLEHYLEHIEEEIEECKDETVIDKKREEAVDILHAAETYVRHLFERTNGSKSFEQVKQETIAKNTARGYYG